MLDLFAAAVLAAATTQAAPAVPQPDAPQATVSDRAVNPSQPDFTLIALPTTLRIPRFGSSFRVTHRFTRPLGSGSFGDLASDFFGFDSGAQVGLEYRFGILAGTQVGIHRTSDRTIMFFAQHQVVRESDRTPIGLDVIGTVDGAENFRRRYSAGLGAVLSRSLGRRGAVYAQPIWINNANPSSVEGIDDDTFLLGLGARLRIRPTVYLVGEAAPRFGFTSNVNYYSFAIERRAGGHSFQINFSNGFGTTIGQLAYPGGLTDSDLYIGFNISRKFF